MDQWFKLCYMGDMLHDQNRTSIQGIVEKGSLSLGDTVTVCLKGQNVLTTVMNIEINGQIAATAHSGDLVQLTFRGMDPSDWKTLQSCVDGRLFPLLSKYNMVFIPQGSFLRKEREIYISHDFFMGKYPFTQNEWKDLTGANPSGFQGDMSCPVENISWVDIQSVLTSMSQNEGLEWRLPTEAEWEYAARCSTTRDFHFTKDTGLTDLGWYKENSGGATHSVGKRAHNLYGLYDLHGNVWELCQDWYDKDYIKHCPTHDPRGPEEGLALCNGAIQPRKVMKGGSWYSSLDRCALSFRGNYNPHNKDDYVGFRLCMSI